MSDFETNRRDFLQSAAVAGCALGAGPSLITPDAAVARNDVQDTERLGGQNMRVTLTVNRQQRSLEIDARTTLLDALREHIGLTGTKKRLRSRAVRRLHGAAEWPAHQFLPHARGDVGRRRHHHHRGTSLG
jgi:hypothetical protein